MTNADPIQVLMLGVQTLGLIGLAWYVIETQKIRKAAQQQVKISLDLIKAATDQVEGMSKPCLTLWGTLRDGQDVILEMDEAIGNVVARGDQGNYVVQNIGNGVALNVEYSFTRKDNSRRVRYIPNVFPTSKVTLVEPMTSFSGEHTLTLEYESIGGRRYRSTLSLNHYVITSFVFGEAEKQNSRT